MLYLPSSPSSSLLFRLHAAEYAAWIRFHHPQRRVLGALHLHSTGMVLAQTIASHYSAFDAEATLEETIRLGAGAVLLFQHHPDGLGRWSACDLELTQRFLEATQSAGIQLHDHLIVAEPGSSASLAAGQWRDLPSIFSEAH